MNTVIKVFVIVGIFIGAMTLVQFLIPATLSDSVNNSIVYLLNYINYLSPVVHVATIFTIIKLLSVFYLGIATFYMINWIVKMFL